MVPISQLCDVCNIKYDLISRQESLSENVQEILRQTNNIPSSRLSAIQKSMNTASSMLSLVSSHIFHYNNNHHDCPNRMLFMEQM